MSANCCFSGRGKISMAQYDAACSVNKDLYPLIQIGNASSFDLSASINTINGPKNYQTLSGISECAPIETIDQITLKMKIHCMSAANVGKAYSATNSKIASATLATQSMTFTVKGQTIPFRTTDGVIATGVSNVTGITGTAGVDYVVGANGVYIPETSTLTLPVTETVTFDHAGYDLLQLLTGTGDEYRLFFDGINAANNKAFAGELYRIKIKPSGVSSFIQDGFQEWDLEASVLRDNCKTGNASPYGTFNFLA